MRPEQLLTHEQAWVRKLGELIPTDYHITQIDQDLISFETEDFRFVIQKYPSFPDLKPKWYVSKIRIKFIDNVGFYLHKIEDFKDCL